MKHEEGHSREEHEKIIKDANAHIPDWEKIENISELFKAISDPTRLKILLAVGEGEVCVCCISELLGMSVSAVSHQLKVLRQAHLVKSRREGKNIYYSFDDNHIKMLLDIAIEHMGE